MKALHVSGARDAARLVALGIVCIVTAGLVSCGSAATSPATPSTSTTTTTPTAPAGFTFKYETAVSAADRITIERAASIALSTFQTRLGRTLASTVTADVKATDGPFTGQGQGHLITIYTGNIGWTSTSNTGRTRVIVHELFHILQGEAGWPVDPTQWFFEGAAEYLGYAGAVDGGFATYAAVKNCEIQIYFNGGGAATPPLEQISFSLNSTVNSRYAVAWLAVDRLVNGFDGIPKLAGLWLNAGTWEQRFQATFAAPSAFYTDFAAYRPNLQSPAGNPCGSL